MNPGEFAVGDVVVWADDQQEYSERYDPGPYLVKTITKGSLSVQVSSLTGEPIWFSPEIGLSRQQHIALRAKRFRKDAFLTAAYKAIQCSK